MSVRYPQLPRATARTVQNFDLGWRFCLGDPDAAYPVFDDAAWEQLDLPHDWSIDAQVEERNPSGARGGFFPGGVGWYRKRFTLDEADCGRRIQIEFDGIYMNGSVFINGKPVGTRPYGYSSVSYDLTPFIKSGDQENVLAVRVDNGKQPNSRWYTGSGIYRHVRLLKTAPVHVDYCGTYVTTPDVSEQRAKVSIAATVRNDQGKTAKVEVTQRVLDAGGKEVASATKGLTVSAWDSAEAAQILTLANPKRWDLEHPHLYVARTEIRIDGTMVDDYETPFGIRTIACDQERGFLLNGTPIKLKGVCEHHDLGALGAAVNEYAMERRLKLLQAMGCNAIRTAHNPPAPELLDLCDRMGMLVMDEAFDEWRDGKVPFGYGLYFDAWSERDLRDFLRRDRNHPSVIMWSVGNEIHDSRQPDGYRLAERLVAICHEEDPTRLVTCGCNAMKNANRTAFAQAFDVVGYNGGGGSCFMYDEDRAAYPERRFIATEVPHSLQTRGEYRTLTRVEVLDEHGDNRQADLSPTEVFPETPEIYCSSYDNHSRRLSAAGSWKLTNARSWFMGEFRWTGFDYLGESHFWPRKAGNFGIIDLAGIPKDHYFLYKSLWTEAPMVHILPHWTHPGKEGTLIPVHVYTNADEAELYLNGKSLGARAMAESEELHLSWDVAYGPGALEAKAYRAGETVATATMRTAGPPARIELVPEKQTLVADGRDVVYVRATIVDAEGIPVPRASNTVTFDVSGNGSFLKGDSGDPACLVPFTEPTRPAFNGMVMAICRSNPEPGDLIVTARGEGLDSGRVEVAARG